MQKILAALACALAFCTADAGAQTPPRSFVTQHATEIEKKKIPYRASVEEFIVNNKSGQPAASLFATSYVRTDVKNTNTRPVAFLFNGGPIVAAIGVHMQFGPEQEDPSGQTKPNAPTRFIHNAHSLLDIVDLVVFDPAETGFSRILRESDRPYFYSTAGDTDSLAQLIAAWLQKHQRTQSPLFMLGESYGSIRQIATGALLNERGIALNGQIILGDSIFLQETSRRTHNIISTAVSLPLLAMTAAYHGKADKHGKSDAEFLDEVYSFALTDYLMALSKGYTIGEDEKRAIADKLASYTGIAADYFLTHGLTIAKQDFNRQLLPGKLLNANDTRLAAPLQSGDLLDPFHRIYSDYMHQELKVDLPGIDYRISAPKAFESWDWGPGCNDYLLSAGLCNPDSTHPSIFMDYDYPEVLKRQFANPKFRAMIIAGYYDGLSSIGTHRYLAAQLGFPKDRFSIHEYAGGHMTAADPKAQPLVMADVRAFLLSGQ